MVTIKEQCPDCLTGGYCVIGQSFASGDLTWFRSFQCGRCDCAYEYDDLGIPPVEIREVILNNKGWWTLQMEATGPDRLTACRILGTLLGLNFVDLAEAKKRIPGAVYAGTRTEMEWLQTNFSKHGLISNVVQGQTGSLPLRLALPKLVD